MSNTLFLSILISIIPISGMSLEYHSRIKCVGPSCARERVYTGVEEPELLLKDLHPGICLLDLKTNKMSYIESINVQSTKVTVLREVSEYILERNDVYYNSKLFDRSQKIVPCGEVQSAFSDSNKLSKCLKSNGRKVKKVFCEQERLKNL